MIYFTKLISADGLEKVYAQKRITPEPEIRTAIFPRASILKEPSSPRQRIYELDRVVKDETGSFDTAIYREVVE